MPFVWLYLANVFDCSMPSFHNDPEMLMLFWVPVSVLWSCSYCFLYFLDGREDETRAHYYITGWPGTLILLPQCPEWKDGKYMPPYLGPKWSHPLSWLQLSFGMRFFLCNLDWPQALDLPAPASWLVGVMADTPIIGSAHLWEGGEWDWAQGCPYARQTLRDIHNSI